MQPELENELTDMLGWFKSKLQEDGSGALAIAGSQTKSNTGSRSTSASLHEPKVPTLGTKRAFTCVYTYVGVFVWVYTHAHTHIHTHTHTHTHTQFSERGVEMPINAFPCGCLSDAFPCDFSMRLSMPVLLERRTRMRGGGGWEVVNNE